MTIRIPCQSRPLRWYCGDLLNKKTSQIWIRHISDLFHLREHSSSLGNIVSLLFHSN